MLSFWGQIIDQCFWWWMSWGELIDIYTISYYIHVISGVRFHFMKFWFIFTLFTWTRTSIYIYIYSLSNCTVARSCRSNTSGNCLVESWLNGSGQLVFFFSENKIFWRGTKHNYKHIIPIAGSWERYIPFLVGKIFYRALKGTLSSYFKLWLSEMRLPGFEQC